MFKEERNEFKFDWSHLGDIQQGRPHLGNMTHVAVYRLMQYTLRDAMIKHTDARTTESVFYDAGVSAGKAFYKNMMPGITDLNDFVAQLQKLMKELNIGILRIEESDPESLEFTMTVAEDLDCSGLPVTDEVVCTYDEGFIAGLLEAFAGRGFAVREIDCWCNGDRVCRFAARPAA